MTVSNLGSTQFSPIASTAATQRPAHSTTATAATAAAAQPAAASELPTSPAGLVGHNINTTA
ncbi:hypothetical protein [Paraburkholderia sp. BCC1886]|uniref:hypothetical protein n=1 Tax=Paraburkholderia sp. BCC1886 TaxID=2562670 RepID=UPI0011820836|nr:hypothetical protein [Paraburkholderia sp. BCC1886]